MLARVIREAAERACLIYHPRIHVLPGLLSDFDVNRTGPAEKRGTDV